MPVAFGPGRIAPFRGLIVRSDMFGAFLAQMLRSVIGYMLAIGAASALLVQQWYGSGPEGVSGVDWITWTFAVLTLVPFVGAIAFLPSIVVVLVSEMFRLRHILFFVAAGGAIALLAGSVPVSTLEVWSGFDGATGAGTAGYTLADAAPFRFLTAGLAGGLLYWLIAGRAAGIWRDRLAPPAGPA